jgi:5-methylcytosine-specific restriction endonuclease McrA
VIYKIGPKKGQRKPKAENHLHLHHKHYDTMLNESRDDLMLLCDSCHKLGHMLEKMKNKSEMYKIMYEDFKKQTGWEFKKR